MSAGPPEFRIERCAAARTLEFAAWAWPVDNLARADWPVERGAVQRDAQHRPLLLHYAPGRWLAPSVGAEQLAVLEAAAASGAGVLIEVTGKWSGFGLSGPGAARLLAFTMDIDAALAGRECAAVTLLDCPAIVARSAEGFHLWVQASYATHFLDTARLCGTALSRAHR
jgi:sarcosine oxidase gamma subunit